jgi:Ca-activated chloride channel family protein
MIDMIEEKAKNDIFFTVVGLGMGNYQDAMLEKISNRGNGNYAYIDSLQEANKLFNVDLEKNLTTVAKDVKVQIEFNPNKVQAYRLIGYENRMLKARDFNDDKKDAGEMGSRSYSNSPL